MNVIVGAQRNMPILGLKRHFKPHWYCQFLLEMSFLASVYVRNRKLCPDNYAVGFRNVKFLILFILFAQNIDCGHVILCATAILTINSIRDFGAKLMSRVKPTEFSNDYLSLHAHCW